MAAAAEAIKTFYQAEQPKPPHLRLVTEFDGIIDYQTTPEAELNQDEIARFAGHATVEGLVDRYDALTQFAELVDGSMRTVFELQFDGADLYGPDGRSLSATCEKALQAARAEAKHNPGLWFEVGRRSIELDEIRQLIAMAKGNGSNTMVVTSDFPETLKHEKEDVGGYNVTRQQAMARIVTLHPKTGRILLQSQTLDGSNRVALDAVHADLGFETEPGELLGERRFVNLTAEQQTVLMDRVTGVYDRSLTAQYGGDWYAGRRPADIRNTYDFVRRQQDLVDTWVGLKQSGQLTDGIKYDLAATMQKRFYEDTQSAHPVTSGSVFRATEEQFIRLQREMTLAGVEARLSGKSFSACGGTLRADGLDQSTESSMQSAGYGNKSKDCEFTSKECPECHKKNVRTKSKEINGKTHVSGSCGCYKIYP